MLKQLRQVVLGLLLSIIVSSPFLEIAHADNLDFDRDTGFLRFKTFVNAASTSIKYRTAGFYVHTVPSNGEPNKLFNQGKAGVI